LIFTEVLIFNVDGEIMTYPSMADN